MSKYKALYKYVYNPYNQVNDNQIFCKLSLKVMKSIIITLHFLPLLISLLLTKLGTLEYIASLCMLILCAEAIIYVLASMVMEER